MIKALVLRVKDENMSNKWFISDLHFGHANILKFQKDTRPYSSVEEMDEDIIKTWNDYIKKGDVVYVVGDFSFHNDAETRRIVSRLNGTKILIRGNHDKNKTRTLLDMGFSDVYDYTVLKLSGGSTKKKIALSHYPYQASLLKRLLDRLKGNLHDRWYTTFRPTDYGMPLIHGHHHGGKFIYLTSKGTPCFNVNWDTHRRPISEAEIVSILER